MDFCMCCDNSGDQMFNRFIGMVPVAVRQRANQSASWAIVARDTVSGFKTTAYYTLMITGMTAIGALGVMFVKPHLTDHFKAVSPFFAANIQQPPAVQTPPLATLMDVPSKSFAPSANADRAIAAQPVQVPATVPAQIARPITEEESKIVGTPRQQQWVTAWLAKRYRVAGDAANMLVSATYLTAKEIKLDPLLILAVMAIESGLNPFAESPVGAQGLMQVMSKIHHKKFQDLGGIKAALNPVANIKVGSIILKDYVQRGGSVEAGLKMYVGAAAFESDSGYGSKVLAEYRRLQLVASGKNVPMSSSTAIRAPQKAHAADRTDERKAEVLIEAESTPDYPPKQSGVKNSDQLAIL
jgi:hypothetical protein